jgi:hypothetical protein
MPILNPIPEKNESDALNELIQTYNLVPHDNDQLRLESLKKIVIHINNLPEKAGLTLNDWMTTPDGLNDHVAYHKARVEETASPTAHLRAQLKALNPLHAEENAVTNLKPSHQ